MGSDRRRLSNLARNEFKVDVKTICLRVRGTFTSVEALCAATEGDEFNEANTDLLDTGMDGWEAAQLRAEVFGDDGFSWYEINREALRMAAICRRLRC